MADFDTSIYKPVAQPNWLSQISSLNDASKAASDVAASQETARAMDPTTGKIDDTKLGGALAANPAAARSMVSTLQAVQQLKGAGIQNDQAGLENMKNRLGLVGNALLPLVNKKDLSVRDIGRTAASLLQLPEAKKMGLTPDLVIGALHQLPLSKSDMIDVAADIIGAKTGLSAPAALGAIDKLKPTRQNTGTSADLAQGLKNFITMTQTAQQNIDNHLGAYEPVQLGSGEVGWVRKPGSAVGPQPPGYNQGLPATTPIYPSGGGAPTYAAPPVGGINPPQMVPPQVRQPAQPIPGSNKDQAQAPIPAVPPPGALPTGPAAAGQPPGYTERATLAGKQMGEEQTAASDYRSRVTPLERIVDLLEEAGPRGTGIGTEQLNDMKNLAAQWVPGLMDKGTDAAKTIEELKKYYVQNTLRNADIASDNKLAAAVTGNPNIRLTQASALDLAKVDLALRRMKHAQIIEATDRNVPEADYPKWAAKWNTGQDRRAYLFDLLPQDRQNKLLTSLKGDERKRFFESLRAARSTGVLRTQEQ